jgi:transcriptional regulator with XRE-family HTH domain
VPVARDRLIARRKALSYTQQSLAHAISCERTTVARWERGECEVSAHHRGPLAEALKWSLTELDQALNGDSIPRPEHGWWSNYEALEQSAVSIHTWEPMLIPGLLQTKAYAVAVSGSDELATRRVERQRIVNRSNEPVALVAVLDESALRRHLGHPDVLADQLHHLASAAQRANITVHVLPLDASAQAVALGGKGAFVILEFPWPGGLVHVEHRAGAENLDSHYEIEAHSDAHARLRELALPPAESIDRIRSAAMELDT